MWEKEIDKTIKLYSKGESIWNKVNWTKPRPRRGRPAMKQRAGCSQFLAHTVFVGHVFLSVSHIFGNPCCQLNHRNLFNLFQYLPVRYYSMPVCTCTACSAIYTLGQSLLEIEEVKHSQVVRNRSIFSSTKKCMKFNVINIRIVSSHSGDWRYMLSEKTLK